MLRGTHHNHKSLLKISNAKKGQPSNRRGVKLSEKTKKKLSESHKGKPGFWTGKKRSKETIKKLIKANKGKKHSLETRQKMSMSRSGEKHWNWMGGKSYEPYTIDWTQTLKRSIRERDHYICQLCGQLQREELFSVHHIDYNKKNCNPNNLITLCRSCHTKTNCNRKYWISFFNKYEESK
jgi:formylmethanofuran dehydrogenase subunit E